MMFEFELAYEWLADDSILVSDDINWNEAFTVFTDIRGTESGKISREVGYVVKSS